MTEYCIWEGCDKGPDGGPMPVEEDWEWRDHANGGAYHDSENHIAHKHLTPGKNPSQVGMIDAGEIGAAYEALWIEAGKPGGDAILETIRSLARKSQGRSSASNQALKSLVALAQEWGQVEVANDERTKTVIEIEQIANAIAPLQALRSVQQANGKSVKDADAALAVIESLLTGAVSAEYQSFNEWRESQ